MHNVENIEFTIIIILKRNITWNFRNLHEKHTKTHFYLIFIIRKINRVSKKKSEKHFPNKMKKKKHSLSEEKKKKYKNTEKKNDNYIVLFMCVFVCVCVFMCVNMAWIRQLDGSKWHVALC